jgi:hypothetical protein
MAKMPLPIGTRVQTIDGSCRGVIDAAPAPKLRSVVWDDGTRGDVHPDDVIQERL